MKNQHVGALQEQAIQALRDATTMFAVARTLTRQGNHEEAQRLRNEARAKREASVLIMAKASALENASAHGQIRSDFHSSGRLNNSGRVSKSLS